MGGTRVTVSLDEYVELCDATQKYQRVRAAIDEIKKERIKSYEGGAIDHGWGLQSAIEILERAVK